MFLSKGGGGGGGGGVMSLHGPSWFHNFDTMS